MNKRPDRASPGIPRTGLVTRPTLSSMQKFGGSSATKELKDVLERKIEDLSRQLAEERQSSRQSKMVVSRLQRELSRSRSQDRHQGKEQLSKELEHEKMLRLEAERRLQEMTRESESCHNRLESLQDEFRKMEGMVHDMMQYKSKIDQLKHEKSSLASTYETNIDKFKGHITELERENMMLLNEVKKLESQMNQQTDGRDRYKLLLERLRMIDRENSSLVLENEQQRGQYEKCLDEIANQVVQALLAQKMLREECLKLQDKVRDLEHNNRQLCTLFQQRMKQSDGSSPDGGVFIEGSMESIISMFSEKTADNASRIPAMSSPPLWLQQRLPGDRQSIISFSGSITSTPERDGGITPESMLYRCRTEIETEFPATPSSPKSKHVSFMERNDEVSKRSSSTSSLLPPKSGPNRQRTRSTSSLSRARGISLLSPQNVSLSHDSGIQNTSTNEHSGYNQGMAESANQKSSKESLSNQKCVTKLSVPLNNSHPSIASKSSQEKLSQNSSKIPVLPSGKVNTPNPDMQVRRNSLKAEYSIRTGPQTQSVANSPSPSPGLKTPQTRSSAQGSRSSSVSSGSQGHSKSPPVTSGRSHSTGSKIPTTSKVGKSLSSKKSTSKESLVSQKPKTGIPAPGSNTSTKLIPPRSPNLRYSGIRTTLKTENVTKIVPSTGTVAGSTASTVSVSSVTSSSLRMVYSISPVPTANVNDSTGLKKPTIPVHGNKPTNHRAESHFPIMGLTNLNNTSPKSEESANIYANIAHVPSSFSTVLPKSDNVLQVTGDTVDGSTVTPRQYFYDYSTDDDSDFRSDVDLKRPVSTDFSAASTISLDELLDRTLENVDTPLDSDFSTGFYLYNPSDKFKDSNPVSDKKSPTSVSANEQTVNTNVSASPSSGNTESQGRKSLKDRETKNRLSGKPDIVQDTEECEQRKLQQSLTLSQIPGSSMPGYRAKRPKSLILGAKERKFLYCEYGSSSSVDSSDDEWSCKMSYAKNVKQHEIQSKVAKSVIAGEATVITGEATVIESPKSSSQKDPKLNKTNNESVEIKQNKESKLQKPSVLKKPSKLPPPVANKPLHKVNVNSKTDVGIPRPKSVEICVNTALSSVNPKTCYPFVQDPVSNLLPKQDKELICRHKSYEKIEHSEMTLNATFDEVKVERSGSKDDGYSTMSSDIQPENLEKYSDGFENFTNSNEARNSNLSLSSQTSYSSEDRLSGHGSLGRVKAMKMKFEFENHKSPERSPTKSPPVSPARSLLKSPKPVTLKNNDRTGKDIQASETDTTAVQTTKIPKPKMSPTLLKDAPIKTKPAIPVPKISSVCVNKENVVTQVEMKLQAPEQIVIQPKTVQSRIITNPGYSIKTSPTVTMPASVDRMLTKTKLSTDGETFQHCFSQMSTPKHILDQFNQLTCFPPAFDKMELLVDGYDSNSSLSDKGSDLTSLHISEDNILSDIPEENGYESSVGIHSDNTSFSSIPTINSKRHPSQQTTQQSHHASTKFQFSTTLKRHWRSYEGIVRAKFDSDYEKQKQARSKADYEELYGGCLNIETLLERSSSESDMFTRGDKPAVILLPRLRRSRSAECLEIDEIFVEERLQSILKYNMMQQISRSVASADKDSETFSTFVELLIQRGHVMDSPSPLIDPSTLETPTELHKMAVSNFSSKGLNSGSNYFATEERPETELPPLGEEQKKFNSQFYSLCNTGSNRSISEKCESEKSETGIAHQDKTEKKIHTCKNGDKHCKKCEEEETANEFDNISRQIESLSKTVNQLHRSLSSLNSENTDSGSESNEGDVVISSAIGNKDIDGYHWVEDEFFLSPYGGEIILGSSPFSKTGASCDWINEYSDNVDQMEEPGADEELLEVPDIDIPRDFTRHCSRPRKNLAQNSIIADSFDEQGNFDSHHFISKRLKLEEERRRLQTSHASNNSTFSGPDTDFSMPELLKLESNMEEVISARPNIKDIISKRSRPMLKEDTRNTPEKDTDDTEKRRFELFDSAMDYVGSQDSLDDNIGVDNVMCHRLLGNKGHPVVQRTQSCNRPALDFSADQFLRYEAPEIQAMAAFDFLNDMTSSHTSDQSNEQKRSPDQLFRQEEGLFVTIGNQYPMNQSTTSSDSRTSPVKRQRRKLRQKTKKGANVENSNFGYRKTRKFSSTSADESNDDDDYLSDDCDKVTSTSNHNQLIQPNTKMTYL